jgi:hypothetical protein
LSLKTKVDGLSVVWHKNHWDGFSHFVLKTGGDDFRSLPSKPRVTVFCFGSQNQQLRFGDLVLKITTTVSWFWPQNQAGICLSVVLQNRWEGDGVGHALRSSDLLHVEASRTRVF